MRTTLALLIAAAAVMTTASAASGIEISHGFYGPDFASGDATGDLYYARWDNVGGITVEMRALANHNFGYFELPDGVYPDDLPDGNVAPYAIGGVDVDDCGNDDACTPYTLTFSQPLDGAGVVFNGLANFSGSNAHAFSASFFLEAWSGPNGTGALLGRVTDPGGPVVESSLSDFYSLPATLAITLPGIRSIVFSAETLTDDYTHPVNWGSLSRFDMTIEPAPEPATGALLAVGLVGFAMRRRSRAAQALR